MMVGPVYIDHNLAFAGTLIVLFGGWALWNRWAGERQYRKMMERTRRERDGGCPR